MKAIDNGAKRAVAVWHRRAGKDKVLINICAKKMMERVGSYYYFFPTYKQGKKILWNGVDRDGFKFTNHFPKELIKRIDNTEMLVEYVNGSIFQVIGTDNIDSIVGTNPVGCVFSEYSLQDPSAWDFMRPVLLENNGWAIFNYTPRGKNHGHRILETAKQNGWFWQVLTVKETYREDGSPIISMEMLDQERKEGMDEDLIQQEYFCSFNAAIQGSYYGKIMQDLEDHGRFQKGLYEPTLPVQTYWDLGMDDSMSITFIQEVGKEIRVIDYLEDSGEGLEYYAKTLREKPYTYDGFYYPHDAEVRELGTGKSRREVAENLGMRPLHVVQRPTQKEDGIQAVRSILPRMWFDSEKCLRLIDALKSYGKEFDEKNKVFKNHPKHDWSSHAADSVQTFALGHRKKVSNISTPKPRYDKFGRPII